jgi:hypothetical protein
MIRLSCSSPEAAPTQANAGDVTPRSVTLRPFFLHLAQRFVYYQSVTADTFRKEIREAIENYDRYIVCIDKTPDEFEASLSSLVAKAIKAYESRGPQLRHGIALDKHVTVILSQNDNPRPLCGIYFNLRSPYQKQMAQKPVKPVKQVSGSNED